MATSGSFLDESGLSYFWSKLKTRFENVNTRITKIDGEISVIEGALAELIDTGAKNKANPLAAENYNNQGTYPIQAGGVKYTYDSSTGAITTSQQAGNSTTTLKIPITLVVGTEYVVRRKTTSPCSISSMSERLSPVSVWRTLTWKKTRCGICDDRWRPSTES